MRRYAVVSAVVGTMLFGLTVAGCDKGPVQKVGEKVDKATGEERLIGKGPAEKAGREIDKTVSDLKK